MIYNVRRWARNRLLFFLIAPLLSGLTVFATTFAQQRSKSTGVAELFRNNGARCHGADGRGQTPSGELYKAPDLTDAEWWREHSNITRTGDLIRIVTHGKGAMPAFGKKLKRGEISQLVKYARQFRPRS